MEVWFWVVTGKDPEGNGRAVQFADGPEEVARQSFHHRHPTYAITRIEHLEGKAR